jgi:cytochrome b subunit of formate dehydrogenase
MKNTRRTGAGLAALLSLVLIVILFIVIHQVTLGEKAAPAGPTLAAPDKPKTPAGVCPPFKLRDEQGQMLPRKKDFADLYQNLRYFLGKSGNPPRFGRFSYLEKFDYWAVFWGCIIMIGTGIIMLYPQAVAAFLPSNWTNRIFGVAREAHYHEAILAALALFIWHVFNVHFKPGKFPGSMVWWHGKITREEQEREHPLEREELRWITTHKKNEPKNLMIQF